MIKVEMVSLGKVARSTNRTLWPRRASNIAVGEPAHRAPTTIASYLRELSLRGAEIPIYRLLSVRQGVSAVKTEIVTVEGVGLL
jgi:hypothetical protein